MCAGSEIKKSRFSDSTCLPEESFPDGPVPAALPRHYRARRMGIDFDDGRRERDEQRRERRNRSKIGRGERIELGERERESARK